MSLKQESDFFFLQAMTFSNIKETGQCSRLDYKEFICS